MQSTFSPFRIVFIFIMLAFVDCMILPRLKVDLLPGDRSSEITIAYSLPDSSPDLVEQQVTGIIEGVCSQVNQLKKIYSVSKYNGGYVRLRFDKTADIEFIKFELASLMRQAYSRLPQTCSYPVIISSPGKEEGASALLVYSINAPQQELQIKKVVEPMFQQRLAGVKGISEIMFTGAQNLQLTIQFDRYKCAAWQLDPNIISTTIKSYFATVYPGSIINNDKEYFLQLSVPKTTIPVIENIMLPTGTNQIVRLKNVAKVFFEEQKLQSYFRINGKSSISASIYAKPGENRIILAKAIKQLIHETTKQLPPGYEVLLNADDSSFLVHEINKNLRRIYISCCILFLFILLAYRSKPFVLTILGSLLVHISLTIVLAWFFNVDFHLYSIAGLAISFGIMTDIAIVMTDYYHQYGKINIFKALLGSCLAIIVSLCLIFFLPDEEKKNLVDFSIIMILSLFSSLIIALLFIPALYVTLNSLFNRNVPKRNTLLVSGYRKRADWSRKYFHIISFVARHRKTFITGMILGFGLPFFMLPSEWEGDHWYNRWYNASLGSKYYQENIKPPIDTWLGGAFRLFYLDIYQKSNYRNPEKTKLFVSAELPYGNTIEEMNSILTGVDKYLSRIKGIDKYITTVNSGQYGKTEITFKSGFENSDFPYLLKSKLTSYSLTQSGVGWSIYGVGQAFSNVATVDMPRFLITMKGYNFDELSHQTDLLAKRLLHHKRIQHINTNERQNLDEKPSKEYLLTLDAPKMTLRNTNQSQVLNLLSLSSLPSTAILQLPVNEQYYPVLLKEKEADYYSNYNLLHDNIQLDSNKALPLNAIAKIEMQNTMSSIQKEDRQYIRVLSFEYLGMEEYGNKYLSKALKEMNREMPIGYTAEQQGVSQDRGASEARYILLIATLIVAIFYICSVLFENLKEPFCIISMIPISFIGLFLIFKFGNFYFDQGGYAAFIMLGGLVTNAAILIVNDFNNLKKYKPDLLHNRILVRSVLNRSRTVLFTTIANCCGLIPFLVEGQKEVFWFSLAAGTVGGLLFSLFAVFIALPAMLWKKT